MTEAFKERVIELPGRRIRVADVGDMHCGGCRMFAMTRNWCALFGKRIDPDNQVRVHRCLDSEVREKHKSLDPEPAPEPQQTVAWRPRQ